MTNDEKWERCVRVCDGLFDTIADLRMQIAELKAKVAKLEAENAYLETIKDPLRDNIGWSPISDLTFD